MFVGNQLVCTAMDEKVDEMDNVTDMYRLQDKVVTTCDRSISNRLQNIAKEQSNPPHLEKSQREVLRRI